MLQQLFIRNFALIDTCDMTFSVGFNVLSGETGAGKSILIDALGLQLGDRADADWIRHGETRCEIQTSFTPSLASQTWLHENELDDDRDDLCMLRRTLSKSEKSTKSQAYINGRPVPLSQLKTFGAKLVNIHGQHAHQALMHPESQLDLLDSFALANLGETFATAKHNVNKKFTTLSTLRQQKRKLDGDDDIQLADRIDLLTFQVSELETLNVSVDEFDELVAQQKQLSAGQTLSLTAQQLTDILTDAEQPLTQGVNHALTLAQDLLQHDERAKDIVDVLEQASINIDEASSTLSQYAAALTLDPETLHDVEARMGALHDMARKHRVEPHQLGEKLNALKASLDTAQTHLQTLATLDADLAKAEQAYQHDADALTELRKQAAKDLSTHIKSQLAKLSMDKAVFDVEFLEQDSAKKTVSTNGSDKITFMIAPNPGQARKPLHKIASGGELSRISLAIQVASIRQESGMTLIFDEVDAGIGGGTAEVVGQLLKTLSQYHQILCVTHLAQVAAYADCHIKIEKHSDADSTSTQFHILSHDEREQELARMSGGINPDTATKAHAKQLLAQAENFARNIT